MAVDFKTFSVSKINRFISLGLQCSKWNIKLSQNWMIYRLSNAIQRFKEKNKTVIFDTKDVENFINWMVDNPHDFETWIVKKSPAKAAALAISRKKRLSPENEKIILAKKKKGEILEYCTFFGILLQGQDQNQIVLKVTFSGSRKNIREKRYMNMIVQNKLKVASFLNKLLDSGDIDPTTSVKDLLEKIK